MAMSRERHATIISKESPRIRRSLDVQEQIRVIREITVDFREFSQRFVLLRRSLAEIDV